jgi:hypothetical protein
MKSKNVLITKLALLLFASRILAQTTTATATQNQQTQTQTPNTTVSHLTEQTTEKEKKFNAQISLEYSQKTTEEEAVGAEKSMDLTINPSYKINESLTASLKASLSKELSGVQNTTASNTTLGLSIKGHKFSETITSAHSLSAILPTDQEVRERDHLRGAIGVSNGIAYKGDYLSLKYLLGLSKNFHEFNMNSEGLFLNEYRISNTAEIEIPVTEKLSLSATGIYRISFTYEKDQRYGFEIHSDINYEFNQNLAANLGVSNDGPALKPDGVDSNIAVFDEKSSTLRAGLTYIY